MARLLLVAPTVDGEDIGESWVAYQWAKRLGERHDVTLLTIHKRGHQPAAEQLPNIEVVEWSEPALTAKPERFNSLLKPWYPFFHHKCKRWIADAGAAGRSFDIAHQPTPVAMRYPSPLATSGLPYVIGPVGGSLATPQGFRDEDAAPWYVGLRDVDQWRLRRDPQLRRSFAAAAVVCGIAPYVEEALSTIPLQRLVIMSETGLEGIPDETTRDEHDGPIRLLFVGRVIRTKGVRDAVRAMSHLRDLDVVLDIVGDGFDRAASEELAVELGLEARVRFHGRRPRAEVDDFYRRSDVFVFPSYREPGGNAPFEALSFGLPMIVADRGGPAAAVDVDCAFMVTPNTPEQYAQDIADRVRRLVMDPDLRAGMSKAARERAAAVGTWEQRVRAMEQVYASVMQTASESAR